MFPRFARSDSPNAFGRYIQTRSNGASLGIGGDFLANLPNIGFLKLGVVVPFALNCWPRMSPIKHWAVVASTFCLHIVRVVLNCPDKQVVCPNAGRVVAMVADEQSPRDLPIGKLPSYTMGAVVPVDAVSLAVASPRPKPAGIGALNLGPEARGKGIGYLVTGFGRTTTKRIAVAAHSQVMGVAKASGAAGDGTGQDGAGRLGLHLGLILRGVMGPDVDASRLRSIVAGAQ